MPWMNSKKGVATLAVAAGLALTVGAGNALADEVAAPGVDAAAPVAVASEGVETGGSASGDAVPGADNQASGSQGADSNDGSSAGGQASGSDSGEGSGPAGDVDGEKSGGVADPGADSGSGEGSGDDSGSASGKDSGSDCGTGYDEGADGSAEKGSGPGSGSGDSDFGDDSHDKPYNGWWTNPATGKLEYYENGKLTTPDRVFYTDSNGDRYWYENGVMREEHTFYDPASDKWYWADAGGKCARNKDTYIPVNDEAEAGDWRNNGNGKWVRVGDDFAMVKGEDYRVSKDDGQWHWWFFDTATGQMNKNFVYVGSNGGKWVYYDDTYGWMVYGEQYRQTNDHLDWGFNWYYFDDATGATTYGWKYLGNGSKWVWYDTTTGVMAHGWRIIDGYHRNFDNATGACDKVGYQNDPRYYQVSSWNVSVPGSGRWAFATPSRIAVDATREDCIEAMIARAYEYLGSPYVWDYACAPGVGVDCAGLVMQCLYATGMDLSPYTPWDHYFTAGHDHYANDMWNDSRFMHVDFGSRQRGDLICYSGHIAIYLGNDTILEAYTPATGVRISNVYSSSGIKGALRPFN